MATGWKIGVKDATDDRLANLLSILGSSQHQAIQSIETCLGQHLIRAYELPTERARSDTTSWQGLPDSRPLGNAPPGCHSSWQWRR